MSKRFVVHLKRSVTERRSESYILIEYVVCQRYESMRAKREPSRPGVEEILDLPRQVPVSSTGYILRRVRYDNVPTSVGILDRGVEQTDTGRMRRKIPLDFPPASPIPRATTSRIVPHLRIYPTASLASLSGRVDRTTLPQLSILKRTILPCPLPQQLSIPDPPSYLPPLFLIPDPPRGPPFPALS